MALMRFLWSARSGGTHLDVVVLGLARLGAGGFVLSARLQDLPERAGDRQACHTDAICNTHTHTHEWRELSTCTRIYKNMHTLRNTDHIRGHTH